MTKPTTIRQADIERGIRAMKKQGFEPRLVLHRNMVEVLPFDPESFQPVDVDEAEAEWDEFVREKAR